MGRVEEANKRPGKLHQTYKDRTQETWTDKRTRLRNGRKTQLAHCPKCKAQLTKENYKLVCVACRAEEARAEALKTEAPDIKFFAYTSAEGETVLIAPLGVFIVEGVDLDRLEDIPDPKTKSEDMFMPTHLQPGSLAKVNAMRDRFEHGLPVFHSEDRGAWNKREEMGTTALEEAAEAQSRPEKKEVSAGTLWDLEKELATV